MEIVTVIPLKKSAFADDLTYFTAKDIPPGSIVTIPLRNKKVLGLVVTSESVLRSKADIKDMSFNLKKIIEVKKQLIFTGKYIESAIETGKYFATSKSNAVTSLIPSIFREKYDVIAELFGKEAVEMRKEIESDIKAEKLLLQIPIEERIHSYKILIRESFARKSSIFIVLPAERDISFFYQSLSHGIEQFIFAIHGGLSSKKVLHIYEQIMTLTHPVLILGTAPYLSIPRGDIETIILEHESTNGYKIITKPHIDLRIFVEIFASKINAKLILSDTILSIDTLGRSENDGLVAMHPLSYRINFEGSIEIITRDGKKFTVLTDESIRDIKNKIAAKKNVFIFTLRKGLATQTVCNDCNEIVSCDRCFAPLVLHNSRADKKRAFVCNRCGNVRSADAKCISCGSWNLRPLGIGTDTVYEEIKRLFPKIKIFKLDKDTAKNQKNAEKIIKEFEETRGSILVGTEMVFFYLKAKVQLSIVASFDSLWSIPNFRISEKIIQLIISIISRTSGKFIIQTRNGDDPSISAIKNGNLLPYIREVLDDRRNLNYPPFKRFIKISHSGNHAESIKARRMIGELFGKYEPEVYGGYASQPSDKYVTNALIKIDTKNWSLPELSENSSLDEHLLDILLALPFSYEVAVDPEDMS